MWADGCHILLLMNYNLVIFWTLLLLDQLYVYSKTERKVQRFPIYTLPHIWLFFKALNTEIYFSFITNFRFQFS